MILYRNTNLIIIHWSLTILNYKYFIWQLLFLLFVWCFLCTIKNHWSRDQSVMSTSVVLCHTWTCYLVSRPSCSLWTHWCPCCLNSPGSACRTAALLLTAVGGAGWSGGPWVGALRSCDPAWGCRPWQKCTRAMRTTCSSVASESRAAPPTDTEPLPPHAAWVLPSDGAALRSPDDLQGGVMGKACQRFGIKSEWATKLRASEQSVNPSARLQVFPLDYQTSFQVAPSF